MNRDQIFYLFALGLVLIVLYNCFSSKKEGMDTVDKLERPQSSTLYYFFAPWCGYCKDFTPVWDELKIDNVNLVKINSDDPNNQALVNTFQVRSYPTLILVISDRGTYEYGGSRDPASIKSFVQNKITEVNSNAYKQKKTQFERVDTSYNK